MRGQQETAGSWGFHSGVDLPVYVHELQVQRNGPAGSRRGSIASISQLSSLEVCTDGAYSVLILNVSNHL